MTPTHRDFMAYTSLCHHVPRITLPDTRKLNLCRCMAGERVIRRQTCAVSIYVTASFGRIAKRVVVLDRYCHRVDRYCPLTALAEAGNQIDAAAYLYGGCVRFLPASFLSTLHVGGRALGFVQAHPVVFPPTSAAAAHAHSAAELVVYVLPFWLLSFSSSSIPSPQIHPGDPTCPLDLLRALATLRPRAFGVVLTFGATVARRIAQATRVGKAYVAGVDDSSRRRGRSNA
ncbi:hypothetical protein MSAN_01966200 [Mycena sanguinolenta]|uniref:Uncharacterized protein n=1 Tax=Mycena sanguinolenta TaxID=230812 RepID=A0A8H6XNZ9_9AGAR|nr:hypothetical protein MSAN_01966200 [Mycena sanguinolenta]